MSMIYFYSKFDDAASDKIRGQLMKANLAYAEMIYDIEPEQFAEGEAEAIPFLKVNGEVVATEDLLS